MKFCPKCQARLKNSLSGLKCANCDYLEQAVEAGGGVDSGGADPEFNVLGDEPDAKTLPTIATDCAQCGNGEAIWWMMQTRSADEPTTRFYRCTKCRHTWRDYS